MSLSTLLRCPYTQFGPPPHTAANGHRPCSTISSCVKSAVCSSSVLNLELHQLTSLCCADKYYTATHHSLPPLLFTDAIRSPTASQKDISSAPGLSSFPVPPQLTSVCCADKYYTACRHFLPPVLLIDAIGPPTPSPTTTPAPALPPPSVPDRRLLINTCAAFHEDNQSVLYPPVCASDMATHRGTALRCCPQEHDLADHGFTIYGPSYIVSQYPDVKEVAGVK